MTKHQICHVLYINTFWSIHCALVCFYLKQKGKCLKVVTWTKLKAYQSGQPEFWNLIRTLKVIANSIGIN